MDGLHVLVRCKHERLANMNSQFQFFVYIGYVMEAIIMKIVIVSDKELWLKILLQITSKMLALQHWD